MEETAWHGWEVGASLRDEGSRTDGTGRDGTGDGTGRDMAFLGTTKAEARDRHERPYALRKLSEL